MPMASTSVVPISPEGTNPLFNLPGDTLPQQTFLDWSQSERGISLSTKQRHTYAPRRRKLSPRRKKAKHPGSAKTRSAQAEKEILRLVRTGVERFILKRATVDEFVTTIRSLTKVNTPYVHPLTKSAFAKIVKDAIRKRNLRNRRKS